MITTLTPSPSIDFDYEVGALKIGGVNRAHEFNFHAGGKGLNVARVLTLMKVNAVAIVPMAKSQSNLFINSAESENIKLDIISIESQLRFNISLLHDGLTTKINAASAPWSDAEAQKVANRFKTRARRSQFAVIGGSLPAGLKTDWLPRVVAENVHRTKVVVDSSGETLRSAIASKPFLIKPNEDEASEIIGSMITTLSEALQACRELHFLGAQNVLLSLGDKGCLFFNGKDFWRARSNKFVAVNTVGAGDALLAGFIGRYKSGVETALATGVAWAEAAIKSRGTSISLPPSAISTDVVSRLTANRLDSFEDELTN